MKFFTAAAAKDHGHFFLLMKIGCVGVVAFGNMIYPKTGFGIYEIGFENDEMPNPIHDPRYTVFRTMLQETRIAKGLLQADVADRLGKNQSFVSKYERGERRLDFPEFLDVAQVLDIKVSDFIKRYKAEIDNLSSSFRK